MRNIHGASPMEVAKKVASKLLIKNIYNIYFSIVEIETNKIINYQSNKKELVRPYHKNGKLVKYMIIVKKRGKQVGGILNLDDENDPIYKFFPKDRYTISRIRSTITIQNKTNKLCIEITINIIKNNIYIESLKHCGYSGRTNLEAIIEYSKELNKESKKINFLYLVDASYLKHQKISLSILYILSIGISWYNKVGFISSNYDEEVEHNRKFLVMSLGDFLNECIEKIIDITAIFKKSIFFSNKNIAFLNIFVKTIKHRPSL